MFDPGLGPRDALVVALLVVSMGACASNKGAAGAPAASATATLRDAAGATVGTARLTESATGLVTLVVDVHGLTAGSHGIHLHTVGSCVAGGTPAFAGAGGHYNPTSKSHGLQNPQGPHAGDLPNLEVRADGTGHLQTTNDRVTLTAGAHSLLDADGSALVIHAAADDQKSDPAGNSGARIACGVIERS